MQLSNQVIMHDLGTLKGARGVPLVLSAVSLLSSLRLLYPFLAVTFSPKHFKSIILCGLLHIVIRIEAWAFYIIKGRSATWIYCQFPTHIASKKYSSQRR